MGKPQRPPEGGGGAGEERLAPGTGRVRSLFSAPPPRSTRAKVHTEMVLRSSGANAGRLPPPAPRNLVSAGAF